MRRILPLLIAAVIGVPALVIAPVSAASAHPARLAPSVYVEGSDPQAKIFDPLKVIDVKLTMEQPAIDALFADPRGNYQLGTMSVRTSWGKWGPYDIGIRLKGVYGSYRWLDRKAGFKVKIDFVDSNLRFFGLKKLTLNNMVQDGSYIHEALAYRVFRAMDIPAPRVGYANVSFNGIPYGLYVHIETYDKPMLTRWFDKTQHLYEGSYWMDVSPGNEWAFEADEGDPSDRADLIALIAAANTPADRWWSALAKVSDRSEFVREWATETYIGHWDGYSHWIRNNYFLHSDNKGKFTLMPWGTDQTFGWTADWTDISNSGIMYTQCMQVRACWAEYHRALLQLSTVVPNLQLDVMAQDISAAIHLSLLKDPRRGGDACNKDCRKWATVVAELAQGDATTFVANRIIQLNDYLRPMLPETPSVTVTRVGKRLRVGWTSAADIRWPIKGAEIQIRVGRGDWRNVSAPQARPIMFTWLKGRPSTLRLRVSNELGTSSWSTPQSFDRP
ncbi:unannotated protein [freshwater metagenome]|uniref:Unannotated protein n=1 Tax=freshwater metagenome TaxID=449393 RepID=A0A6J7GUX5_9ZZZZ|nr:hypothetical protein [Actinomycetota bacterium]